VTSKLLQKRAANKGRDRMQTFFVQIKCALGRTYEVASGLAEAETSVLLKSFFQERR